VNKKLNIVQKYIFKYFKLNILKLQTKNKKRRAKKIVIKLISTFLKRKKIKISIKSD